MVLRISYFVVLLCVCAVDVFANTIVPASGQTVRYVADGSAKNMLHVAPPNAAGISINRFSKFETTSPLLLVNTPTYQLATGAPVNPARTVVLIAEKFDLKTSIDVVGPATDVVLLTNSAAGSISCVSCSFDNVLRLSLLANKSVDISASASQLGNFEAMGSITISGLSAPGAIGLDVLARTMKTSGEITLNQRVMDNVNGGYSATPTGKYIMGSGGIDFVSGSTIWNYENRQIIKVNSGSSLQEIAGVIKAPRVSISSANGIRLAGKIDTRVDILGAVSYQGETHVSQEGVVLQALFKDGSSGVDVVVSGGIYSDNTVELRATRDVTLQKSADINALKVAVLSGQAVKNFGSTKGVNLSVAGTTIDNEGLLEAEAVAHLWAENDVANQYGGVIRAPEIILDSVNAAVRNGSRTPYRTEAAYRNNLFNLALSDILTVLEKGQEFNPSSLNSSMLGAYYLMPGSMLLLNDGSAGMPDTHTAHIIGQSILIRAPAFENINPYYEKVINQEVVSLQRHRINQVMVSAERLLEVQGPEGSAENRSEYMMNSSALISVNAKTGKLRVQSKRLINDRFRITTYFQKYSKSSNPAPAPNDSYTTKISQYEQGYASVTSVYSPPGFLSVMGKAEINANLYFANIMGYFEVFSGADINSIQMKNLGIENQGVGKTTTKVETVFSRPDDYSPGTTRTVVKDPRDLDSLFFVQGTLNAADVDAWFGVLNPFHYFLTEAVESREADIRSQIGHHLSVNNATNCADVQPGSGQSGCESRSFVIGSLSATVDPENVMKSASTDKIQFNYEIDVRRSWGGRYASGYKPPEIQKAGGEGTIGLFETLEKYYQIVKQKISDMLNEFNWWGLAE
jgi:hypothetical protein